MDLSKITNRCFLGLIAVLTVANIAAPKAEVSWDENRTLNKFPSLDIANITGGKFDDEFESWFSDHFVGRKDWIALKAGTRKAALAIENNNVYMAKGGRLVQTFQSYSEETLAGNEEIIHEFCGSQDMTGNILIVPTAAWGAQSVLPDGAWNVDQPALLQKIGEDFADQNFIDYTKTTNASPSLYFRTDHHWNEQGAYLGYAAIAENVLHKDPLSFDYTLASDAFEGTMYSKSGAFWTTPDSIHTITPKDKDLNVTVSYDAGKEVTDSLFSEKRLSEKDKYTYYVDGNHAEVNIRTNAGTGRKALIIKDSYAHILIPYLACEYDEIEMIDLRYYHSPVSELLSDKENTDLYFIYSLDNFCSDPNLAFLR